MNINFEKIKKETGCNFENIDDMFSYMECILEHLTTHNKNYTKEQYYKIITLHDIVKNR
jgi:hypothetical protein